MQNKLATAAAGVNTGIDLQDHAAIGKAGKIPVSAPTPVVSVSLVVLSYGKPLGQSIKVMPVSKAA